MKKILFLLAMLISLSGLAQTTPWSNSPTVTPQTRTLSGSPQIRWLFGSNLYSIEDSLAKKLAIKDSTTKYITPYYFNHNTGTSTQSLLNLKLNIADTASMLSTYLHLDAASVLYKLKADTISAQGYARNWQVTNLLSGYIPNSRLISTNAGTGTLGGGSLASNLTIYNDTSSVVITKNYFNTVIGTATLVRINSKSDSTKIPTQANGIIPFWNASILTGDTLLYRDPTNGNLASGTKTLLTNQGKLIYNYNSQNTGTVASNSTILNESKNRNANFIARVPASTGAGGLIVQNTAGTNMLQFSLDQALGWPKSQIITAGVTNMVFNALNDGGTAVQGLFRVGGSSILSGANNSFYGQSLFQKSVPGTIPNSFPAVHSVITTVPAVGNGTQTLGSIASFISLNDTSTVVSGTKPYGSALNISLNPLITRNNSPYDDFTGINLKNVSANNSKITEYIYVGHNSAFTGGAAEAGTVIKFDVNAGVGIGMAGTYDYGLDFAQSGFNATINQTPLRITNNTFIKSRNAANNADISLIGLNSSDLLSLYGGASTISSGGILTTPFIYGSSASGGNLTIGPSSHATKGNIYLGASATNTFYDGVNNAFHVNSTTTERFSVQETTGATSAFKATARFLNATNQGLTVGSDFDGASAATDIRIAATGSLPLALGTSSSNFALYVNNDGAIKTGSQATATSWFDTQASTTAHASLLIPNGTAPTVNVPGQLYAVGGALKYYDNIAVRTLGYGTVSSVSGTTNRVTVATGTTTPVIDISSTFEALLGKVANPLSQFSSTTSAQLAGVLSDETGFNTGAKSVFSISPAFTGTSTFDNLSINGGGQFRLEYNPATPSSVSLNFVDLSGSFQQIINSRGTLPYTSLLYWPNVKNVAHADTVAVQGDLLPIKGTPTISAGAGAGTGPTVSVTTNGKQLQVTVVTGTLPTGLNAVIATVTLPTALLYTPYPVFSSPPGSASLLNGASMVGMSSSGPANVTITSGTTAVPASTTLVWNIAL